jgi:translation initiation factor IF-2
VPLLSKTGIQVPKVISELMKNGILATINQTIDYDTAELIATDFGVEVKKLQNDMSTEEIIEGDIASILKDDAEHGEVRPPIVTVMGHVDHGKTQLLDTIRKSNVVAGESGGITQHVAAYQVDHNGKKITFIDTPGHEAFTSMRARGAKLTDIAILVVAADEGMKPQTIEAMNHAKEAGVTIIVAINKIDKENANIDMVKGQLTEHELTPEDWGGKTIVVAYQHENQ